MWLFLLAARHRMQALSALACSVGCGFGVFASVKIALFIQTSTREANPFYFWVSLFFIIMWHKFGENELTSLSKICNGNPLPKKT